MTEPLVMTSSALDFQRDLGKYWRYVRRMDGINLTAQGWIYKSAFKGIQAALNQTETSEEQNTPRMWFMRRLMTQTGDLRDSTGRLTIQEPSKLFSQPMDQRMKSAFLAWRDGAMWHELVRISPYSENEISPSMPPELPRARIAMMQVLAALSESNLKQWVPVEGLAAELKRSAYEWLFARTYRGRKMRGANVYHQTPYYGTNNPYGFTITNRISESQGWDMVERVVINVLLNEPLHWLGLVDLTYASPPANARVSPISYRLTPLGAWLLKVGPQPQFSTSGGRLVVQPNFTVLAIEPLDDQIITTLDGFADVAGGDRAVNYNLTRESVFRAQYAGTSTDDIIQFLEQHHGNPLPPNIKRTLQEWDTLHHRITIHRKTSVLQYADDEAQTAARGAIPALREFAPGFAFTSQPHKDTLRTLQNEGWEPLVSNATSNDGVGAVSVNEDGSISFRSSVPSVHVMGTLAAFSEGSPVPKRLSQQSVRGAISRGAKLDILLMHLKGLCGGVIPDSLETNLRTWAGFYGNATLLPMHVLTLESAEALSVLAADKALKNLLHLVEGAVEPIALVREQDMAKVRDLLLKRGVVLKD